MRAYDNSALAPAERLAVPQTPKRSFPVEERIIQSISRAAGPVALVGVVTLIGSLMLPGV